MNRAEQRRNSRNEQKYKTSTYNFTREQLDTYVRDAVGREIADIKHLLKEQATKDAVTTIMTLVLTLPMKVLMDHFWKKSASTKIPKFTELVLEYYDKWQNDELDMDQLREELWEYAGVKLVETDGLGREEEAVKHE